MRSVWLGIFCFAAAVAAGSCDAGRAAPAQVPAKPLQAQGAVCRPTFAVDGQSLIAGTGFVLEAGGAEKRVLLVSAQHLFGPDGGLGAAVPWSEMPRRATGISCAAFKGEAVWAGGPALAIPGARAMGKDVPVLRDISAFPLSAASAAQAPVRLKLARTGPRPGDDVWVVTQLLGGAPSSQLLHHAKVVEAGPRATYYRFDNVKLVIQATSGAPVVNGAGEVVGINLGGGAVDGELFGVADTLPEIRKALADAGVK